MKPMLFTIRENRGAITEIIVWCLIFVSPLILHSLLPNASFRMLLLVYAQLVVFVFIYYLNVQLLIPRFLFKGKIWHYLVLAILLMVLVNFLLSFAIKPIFKYLMSGNELPVYRAFHERPLFVNVGRVSSYLLVMVLGVALKSFQRWQNEEQLNIRSQKEKLDTELAFLKNQINPHFFFNTMNTIYSLTATNTKVAQETILKLSKLMRYLLYETEKQYTTLDKEIEFLQGYVDLMRVRLTEGVRVDFKTSVNLHKAQIPPLLFIPFVENAFKHGVSNTEPCSIEFWLYEMNRSVVFKTVNQVHRKENFENGSGVGLENVKRRLALLYDENKYQLSINEENNQFCLTLMIPLNYD